MDTCAWREDGSDWHTGCGDCFTLFDGTPAENDMTYCCYCGKKIEEFREEKQKC